MISFECASCGNTFRVEKDLAGRYGWCRVCKGLIIVPGADEAPFSEWDAEKKIKKLESILRQAGLRQERDGRYIRKMRDKMKRDETGNERIVELREKVHELRGRLESAEKHHTELIGTLEQNGVVRGNLEEMASKLQHDISKLTADQAESTTALEEARKSLAEANETIERLRHELADRDGGGDASALQSEIDGLAAERDAALKELEDARKSIRDFESAQQDIAKAEAEREEELTTLRAEAESQRKRAGAAESERDDLKTETDALRKQAAHQDGELETLKRAIIHAKEEVDRLEAELADYERTAADRDSLRAQLQESETARASLAEKLGRAEARAEAADDHRTEAQGRLDTALEKVARLTEEMVTAMPAIAHDDSSAAKADNAALDEMRSFIDEANEARRDAEKRAEVAERDLSRVTEEKGGLEERVAALDREKVDAVVLNARLEDSQTRVRELTQELAALAKQVAELESDGKQKDEEILRMRNQMLGIDTDDSPPRSNVEWPIAEADGGDALMPDFIDEEGDDDMLTDSLLRFIQPE